MHQPPRRLATPARDAVGARVEAAEGSGASPAQHSPAPTAGPEGLPGDDHLDRLLADVELLTRLQLSGYTGREWNAFATELARYGVDVLSSWMYKRTIFDKLQAARGVKLQPLPAQGWDYETRWNLASLTVVIALAKFRDTVLIPHRWDPNRGATLKTYFVGQCLIRFPNVYREWLVGVRRAVRFDVLDDTSAPASVNVEREVVGDAGLQLLLDQAPDDRTRLVLLRLSEGCSQREIADELGCSVKTVEHVVGRHRQRERKRIREDHEQAS